MADLSQLTDLNLDFETCSNISKDYTTKTIDFQLKKEEILSKIDFRVYYENQLGTLPTKIKNGWIKNISCPFHDEKTGSFGVNIDTGAFKCFGCGAKGDVFNFVEKRNGIDFKDAVTVLADFTGVQDQILTAVTAKFRHFELGYPSVKYPYCDASGNILYYVCRFEPKDFRPCNPGGHYSINGTEHVPYRLQQMSDSPSKPVYITEGEKDADTLSRIGLVATCKANCSGDWGFAFCEKYFSGRDVVVLRDNDLAGSVKMGKAVKYLTESSTASVRALPAFGLVTGYDVTDWIRDGHGIADIELLVARQEYIKQPLLELVKPVSVKEMMTKKPPPRRWLLRGFIAENTVNITAGEGGIGKSNLALYLHVIMACGMSIGPFIADEPVKILLINVEDDIDDIWRRIYAFNRISPLSDEHLELLDKNLIILSGRGVIGPLMSLDNNRNPVETESAVWLRKVCEKYKPDLTTLDTKSRLYGLNENDNDHGSRWIAMLEALHKCAWQVLCHTGKSNGNINGYASRGASSISDNARSGMLISALSDDDIKLFNIDEPDDVFKLTKGKNNYAAKSSKGLFFRKMDEGIPVYIEVEEVDTEAQKNELILFFKQHDIKKRDIDRKLNSDEIKPFKQAFMDKYGSSSDGFYKTIKKLLNSKILIVSEIKSETGQKLNVVKPFFINGSGSK